MATNKWVLDIAHSEIHFKIRHLVIANITGAFNVFSGTLETKEHDNFNNASINFMIDVYSVDTNNTTRDEHLKSDDFFNADIYPQIDFQSTAFIHIEGDKYKLEGNVTIKGITKTVTLDALFGGEAKDGFGINRAGFEITGKINRNDFGIHAPDVTETGGLVLGEEIKMFANIQFTNETE
ncbi:YceI family protein [Flavobacterium sp. DG1-102-2]|uniref:YceI family protein n=1 Tax=Flavobacterium sp. DG1-102-2 TaxID=3081663 RepID=UPI00294A017E|nr:YceI family protein [Flavobacterium sp. DG1-102-2]MDV6168011.1 YceI family protein [Flavobacterium sp. DG1-102-2]